MRKEIVVGLDGSPSSKLALQWAAQQAKTTGDVLRAVHAHDRPYRPSSTDPEPQTTPSELTPEDLQEDAYRRAITAVFEAVSPHSDWVLEFVRGHPGEVLVQQSKDAQLLVVGTREHVGLDHLLVGSVSHYCLSHAACPVVAVPTPAHDDSVGSAEQEPEQAAAAVTAEAESAERKESVVKTSRGGLVVVGVDGSGESVAAARYAAAAAAARAATFC
jgi:nucleotide-binding universal stress UspA family protein